MKLFAKPPLLTRIWGRGCLQSYIIKSARCPVWCMERHTKSLSTYVSRQPKNMATLYRRHSSNNTDNVTWLWKADDVAAGFNEASKYGTRVACIESTFNSVKPLEPPIFQKVFKHFIKKMPNMGTVIRPRGSEHWLCQVKNPKIDFEILTDQGNFREDCFDLLSKGFHENDTIPWRARVIERGPDIPCHVDGLRKKYPYQYDLMMLHNHALSDGIDLQPMIHLLTKLLDDVAGGRSISEDTIGVFEDNQEFEDLVNVRKEKLLQNREILDAIKKSLPSLSDVPTIFKAFPRPQVSKVTTKHVLRMIYPEMLKGLLSKCSEKKVTFNSFFTAICNVAITELMIEAGYIQDSYKLRNINFIDERRYMTLNQHLHGLHMFPVIYTCHVKGNEGDYFWDYCQKVHQELKLHFAKDGLALDQYATARILEETYPKFNYTDNPRPASFDYSVASMGDLTRNLKGDGDHVQLTSITSFNKIHNYRNCFFQEIFTFKGKTTYTLSYCNDYFRKETVTMIADRVFQLFEKVGK